jgi:hypothetical protein
MPILSVDQQLGFFAIPAPGGSASSGAGRSLHIGAARHLPPADRQTFTIKTARVLSDVDCVNTVS